MPARKINSPQIAGFTLLEVLVVLVIVTLLATLLTQGISHVLSLRLRFQHQLELQRQDFLQDRWFRQICSAMAPDQQGGDFQFSGSTGKMQGVCLGALMGEPGVPVFIRLELVPHGEYLLLQYQQKETEPLEIGRWRAPRGEFTYLDEKGNWLKRWPPELEGAQQLPEAIMLQVDSGDNQVALLVDLPGRHLPRSNFVQLQ